MRMLCSGSSSLNSCSATLQLTVKAGYVGNPASSPPRRDSNGASTRGTLNCGREAAKLAHAATTEIVQKERIFFSSEVQVVTRIGVLDNSKDHVPLFPVGFDPGLFRASFDARFTSPLSL